MVLLLLLTAASCGDSGANPEPKLPDLITELSGVNSAEPGEDLGAKLKETVRNMGEGDTTMDPIQIDIVISSDQIMPEGFATPSDTFSEDALLIGGRDQLLDGLAAGASEALVPDDTEQVPTGIEAGNYYLCARVDSGEDVSESNEDNNVGCTSLAIIALSNEVSTVQITQSGMDTSTSDSNFI